MTRHRCNCAPLPASSAYLACLLAAALLITAPLLGATAAARGLRGVPGGASAGGHYGNDNNGDQQPPRFGAHPGGKPGGGPGDHHGPMMTPPFFPELGASASELAAQLVDPDAFMVISSSGKKPKLTACNVSVAILRASSDSRDGAGAPGAHDHGGDMAMLGDGAVVLSTSDILRYLGGPLPGDLPPFAHPGMGPGGGRDHQPQAQQQGRRGGGGGGGGGRGPGPSGGPNHWRQQRPPDGQQGPGGIPFQPAAHTCTDHKSSAIKRSHDAVTLEFYVKAKRNGELSLNALFATEEGAPWAKDLHKPGVKADDTLQIEVDGVSLEKLEDGSKVTSSALSKLQVAKPSAAAVAGVAEDEPADMPQGGWIPVDVVPGDLPPPHGPHHFDGPAPPFAVVSLKTLKIKRNKTYHIVLRIADTGDREVDSSVLLALHGLTVANV